MVGKPEIVTKRVDGKLMEPTERLTVDIPEEFVGVVMEQLGARRGEMAMGECASTSPFPAGG